MLNIKICSGEFLSFLLLICIFHHSFQFTEENKVIYRLIRRRYLFGYLHLKRELILSSFNNNKLDENSLSANMAQENTSKLGYLKTDTTIFLLCDLQEKVRNVVKHLPAIIKNTQKLLQAGKVLEIELIVSEQCAEYQGETIHQLDISHAIEVYPKLTFSMAATINSAKQAGNVRSSKLMSTIRKLPTKKTDVILFGFEAHVCVEMTAMDLLSEGFNVHVVADCTASRSDEDRKLAFERMRQIGCFVTTTENVICKLMQHDQHPKYNEVKKLLIPITENTALD